MAAFYGTDLDLQLRRRGITNIVLCGISTSIAVESTARDAWERSYNLTFASDAMTDMNADAHERSLSIIFPRVGVLFRERLDRVDVEERAVVLGPHRPLPQLRAIAEQAHCIPRRQGIDEPAGKWRKCNGMPGDAGAHGVGKVDVIRRPANRVDQRSPDQRFIAK